MESCSPGASPLSGMKNKNKHSREASPRLSSITNFGMEVLTFWAKEGNRTNVEQTEDDGETAWPI